MTYSIKIALGNVHVHESQLPTHTYYHGVRNISCSHGWDRDSGIVTSGSTTFGYNCDGPKYDMGYIVCVNYVKNTKIEDCIENEILKTDSELSARQFSEFVLQPGILSDLNSHLVNLCLETSSDHKVVVVAEGKHPFVVPYPAIPRTFAPHIPRLSIKSLLRQFELPEAASIDIVKVEGVEDVLYAFKRHCVSPSEIVSDHNGLNCLLNEALFLDKINSSYIVKPSFFVVGTERDVNGQETFRGYLMPYYPAGSLKLVIDHLKRHNMKGSKGEHRNNARDLIDAEDSDTVVLKSVGDGGRPFGSCSPRKDLFRLSWEIKLLWATQISQAISNLHTLEQPSYSGDIKLENIVLSKEGKVILIDVSPTETGYTEKYIAPELFDSESGDILFWLTAERDVFALGLVLWQIAEEISCFEREDISHSPALVWSTGDDVPIWYRHLVESCILEDPKCRPTMKDILHVLQIKGTL